MDLVKKIQNDDSKNDEIAGQ